MKPLLIVVVDPLSQELPSLIEVVDLGVTKGLLSYAAVIALYPAIELGMPHPERNLLQLKVALALPPLFSDKLRAIIPDYPGLFARAPSPGL